MLRTQRERDACYTRARRLHRALNTPNDVILCAMIEPWYRFVRWGFGEFYNRFAFTYDAVSNVVSRGEWRDWTRAVLPFIRGTRILEIAFGTGNLHLDLHDHGYAPVGVDLSPYMHEITRKKFRAQNRPLPRLVRADVRGLPFPSNHFTSLVMTFPPGFMRDAAAAAELHRVLEPAGVLLWVDAAYLYPGDAWSQLLNRAFRATGSVSDETDVLTPLMEALAGDPAAPRWRWQVQTVEYPTSRVQVMIATKQ